MSKLSHLNITRKVIKLNSKQITIITTTSIRLLHMALKAAPEVVGSFQEILVRIALGVQTE